MCWKDVLAYCVLVLLVVCLQVVGTDFVFESVHAASESTRR